MYTRLIYGAHNTLGVCFLTTVLAFLVGGLAGLIAATVGGGVDQVMARCVDVLMAIPQLIFALLLLTIFGTRSEEHTSELQSLMRISYAVFCLKKKININ